MLKVLLLILMSKLLFLVACSESYNFSSSLTNGEYIIASSSQDEMTNQHLFELMLHQFGMEVLLDVVDEHIFETYFENEFESLEQEQYYVEIKYAMLGFASNEKLINNLEMQSNRQQFIESTIDKSEDILKQKYGQMLKLNPDLPPFYELRHELIDKVLFETGTFILAELRSKYEFTIYNPFIYNQYLNYLSSRNLAPRGLIKNDLGRANDLIASVGTLTITVDDFFYHLVYRVGVFIVLNEFNYKILSLFYPIEEYGISKRIQLLKSELGEYFDLFMSANGYQIDDLVRRFGLSMMIEQMLELNSQSQCIDCVLSKYRNLQNFTFHNETLIKKYNSIIENLIN